MYVRVCACVHLSVCLHLPTYLPVHSITRTALCNGLPPFCCFRVLSDLYPFNAHDGMLWPMSTYDIMGFNPQVLRLYSYIFICRIMRVRIEREGCALSLSLSSFLSLSLSLSLSFSPSRYDSLLRVVLSIYYVCTHGVCMHVHTHPTS